MPLCFFFAWGFSYHSKFFHSYGDINIVCEGLQILTCDRHSLPLSRKGSLACHPYLTWGIPIYGHLQGPMTLTPTAKRLAVELSLPVFTTEVCRAGIRKPNIPHERQKL